MVSFFSLFYKNVKQLHLVRYIAVLVQVYVVNSCGRNQLMHATAAAVHH